jgi:hypothetical protein
VPFFLTSVAPLMEQYALRLITRDAAFEFKERLDYKYLD